jgi:hypothetical protein
MGSILNSLNDVAYKVTYPKFNIRKPGEIKHTVYTYVLETNPSVSFCKKFSETIAEWNNANPKFLMKCVVSDILYQNNGAKSKLKILGSERILEDGDQDNAIIEVHKDAEWFKQHGFVIFRERIGSIGMKLGERTNTLYPTKYFDTTYLLERRDTHSTESNSVIKDEHINSFEPIFNHWKSQYNSLPMIEWTDGSKDTINCIVRMRNKSQGIVEELLSSNELIILNHSKFKVREKSYKYFWYDSCPSADIGSHDITEEVLKKMLGVEFGSKAYKHIIEEV